MKRFLLMFTFILLIVLFVIYSSLCIKAAKEAINICLYTIIPTLLPFFIISNMMISSGSLKPVGNFFNRFTRRLFGLDGNFAFVYLTSSLSGYPMGAKLTCELFESKEISKIQAERFALFSSVTGPAFMSVISLSLLNIPKLFIYILISHQLSMILIIIVYSFLFKMPKNEFFNNDKSYYKKEIPRFSHILTKSLLDSIKTMSLISGLVIIFYIISSIISEIHIIDKIYYMISDVPINKTPIKSLIFGFLEMTNGCIVTSLTSLNIYLKAALCSGLLGFGGLSIYSQTKSILSSIKIKAKGLFLIKLIQGFLSFIICSISLKLFPLKAIETINIKTASNYIEDADYMFLYLYIPIIFVLYLVYYLKKKR